MCPERSGEYNDEQTEDSYPRRDLDHKACLHNNVAIATMGVCRKGRGSGAIKEDFTLKVTTELTLGRGLWLRSKKHMLMV